MCSAHDFAHLGAEEEPAAPRTRPVLLATGEVVQEVILPEPMSPAIRRIRDAQARGDRRVTWSNHTRFR